MPAGLAAGRTALILAMVMSFLGRDACCGARVSELWLLEAAVNNLAGG